MIKNELYKQTAFRPVMLMLIVLAFIQLITWINPSLFVFEHVANYAQIHTSFEFISITISVMVFSIIWAKADRKCSPNLIILACTSLGVALLDYIHVMSFPGMPDFITTNGLEKTIDFWLAGRAFSAIGLLIIAFLPWQTTHIEKLRWPLLLATLTSIMLFTYIVLFFPELTPRTYIDGQGLTPFKIVSEYCLIALYATSALRFFYQIHTQQQSYNILSLFTASTILVMSELYFTLYSDVSDVFNLLGHIYKVMAYAFIYHGVFVSNIKAPYQDLNESRNLLQSVIESIPLRVFWKDRESRYLGCNTLFANDAGVSAPSDITNKDDSQLPWKKEAESYRTDDQQVMNSALPKLAYEETQTTESGDRFWLRTSKVPLHNTSNDVIGMLGIYEDITQQKKTTSELIFLETAIEKSNSSFFKISSKGQVLYANDYACQCLGFSSNELIGMFVWQFDPDFSAEAWSLMWDNRKEVSGRNFETRHQRKDGTIYPVEVYGNYIISDAEDEYTFAFSQDISERKQAEKAQIQLSRAFQLLSQCNSTLIHATDENSIFDEICRLILETGGYKLAWVGLKEDNETKIVKPIVQYGDFGDYFENLHITWDDTELGHGPTGTAIRTKQTVINKDYLSNPIMQPWRDQAIQQGYQSSIALPLVNNKIVLGALSIYSDDPHAFIEEEVKLLEQLTNDLAYGIMSLRSRLLQEEMEERNEFLAYHDPLTGLPNRLLLRDRFEQAVAIGKREKTLVALLFLDLDNFKHVNDSLGHAIGDKLLIHSVKLMHSCIRATDTISRQGGDEFIILLTNLDDVDTAETITQQIIEIFSAPIQVDEYALNISFSIGISLYPNDSQNFDGIVKRADTALYKAKDAGKNTYRFFSEEMNVDAVENMKLQSNLHQALKNDEFQLYYQPQFNTISGELLGAEALLRWHHPELGLISPAKFIPLAERSGLIVDIGEWVINEACKQAQIWNLDRQSPLIMAVNLSAIQFKRGDIVGTVKKALTESGLHANLLDLELTESILLNDLNIAIETLNSFKEMGIHISIDDFGTGYSSLSYLKKLAVNKLKIDQSFVRDMVDNFDDAAIVRVIIQMGHTLQLSVIAEGVETNEQLNLLKKYDCDEIQGYFYSRPIPADEFSKRYRANLA